MKILTLIIKQIYFDQIKAGTKKEEFRDIRPHTFKKYCEVDEEGYALEIDGVLQPRKYDAIRFYVGYAKDRQTMLVKVESARVELFVDENDEFIVYQIDGVEYVEAQVVYGLGEMVAESRS